MKHYLKYFLVSIAIVPFPFSCDEIGDGEDCPDKRSELVAFEEVQINGESLASDTVAITELRMDLLFEVVKIQQNISEGTRSFGKGALFLPRAFALSCLGPHTETSISEITISSSADFSDAYAAGTNLLPLFDSPYLNSSLGSYIIDVVNQLRTGKEDFQGLTEFALLQQPELESVHVFTIAFALSDGRMFSRTTGPLRFQ